MFRLKTQRRNPPEQQRQLGVKIGDGFGSTCLRAPPETRVRRPAPPKKDFPPKKEEKFEDTAKESLSQREGPLVYPNLKLWDDQIEKILRQWEGKISVNNLINVLFLQTKTDATQLSRRLGCSELYTMTLLRQIVLGHLRRLEARMLELQTLLQKVQDFDFEFVST